MLVILDRLEQYETLCDDILARILNKDSISTWNDADLVKRLQEIKNG